MLFACISSKSLLLFSDFLLLYFILIFASTSLVCQFLSFKITWYFINIYKHKHQCYLFFLQIQVQTRSQPSDIKCNDKVLPSSSHTNTEENVAISSVSEPLEWENAEIHSKTQQNEEPFFETEVIKFELWELWQMAWLVQLEHSMSGSIFSCN